MSEVEQPTQPVAKEKKVVYATFAMSKKTLALIIVLFLITCTLLYFAIRIPPYSKNQQSIVPTPTPKTADAHTILSMSPAQASESSSIAQHTLAVSMDTGSNAVSSVQLELAYDPQALINVVVTPGSFFTQPNTLINNVDTTDGRISYAIAQQIGVKGKTGKGIVAYISFDVASGFTGSSTTLTFLPKSAIAADRQLFSVLKKATNYTLTITPTPTSAAVPQQVSQ